MLRRSIPILAVCVLTLATAWVGLMLPRTVDFWKIAAQPLATAFAGVGAITAGALAYLNGHRTRKQDHLLHESKELRAQELALRERYITIAGQLADASHAIRLAAVYSLSSLADNWNGFGNTAESQACIDLLKAYLRVPIEDLPKPTKEDQAERELRQIIVHTIATRRKLPIDDQRSWALSDTNLPGASLRGCKLDGIDLTGVNLRGADLRNASLYQANLTDTSLEATRLEKAKFSSADLSRCNLTFAWANGAFFTGAKGPGAKFTHGRLQGAVLYDCNLIDANFDAVEMQGALLAGAVLRGASFVGADAAKAHFQRADLTSAELWMARMEDVDLSHANLVEAKCSNAKLAGSNLQHTDFSDADLTGSDLRNARLFGAILHRSNMSNADARGALFLNADLNSANLCGTDLTGAMIHTAKLSKETVDQLLHLRVQLELVENQKPDGHSDAMITVRSMPDIQGVVFSPETKWPIGGIYFPTNDDRSRSKPPIL